MTILAFIILGALIALGTAPQALLCLGMASFWALDVHPSIYHLGAMWIALWVGNMPGLSLSAINGNMEPVSDWEKKFKPAGWVLRKLAIKDQFIAGSVGTAVRYLLFIPAVCIAQGWNGIWIGVIVALGAGFAHWLSGKMLRGGDYAGYAVVCAEGISAGILGGALVI